MNEPNYDLILRNGNLLLGPHRTIVGDMAIRDGRIAAIVEAGEAPPEALGSAWQELDARGRLVSPPFVESHVHLDSALTVGQPRWNQSGTLFEGIDIWRDRKAALTPDDVAERSMAALRQMAARGTLVVRSHVDVTDPDLVALRALASLRDRVADWMTVQLVAFPQDGLFGHPDNEALLEASLDLGVDAIGGIPHYEMTREDGTRSIRRLFRLAEQRGLMVDMHCDEIDDPQSRFLEVMAAEAIASGLGDRVTASHACAMGSYENAYAMKLMGFLVRSGIQVVANPPVNLVLQGRGDSYPKRRGITRVKELWQAGVNVALGSDCLQDPWYPLGTGSALDAAHLAVHACHMTGAAEIDACYDMVTWHGARVLQLPDYGLMVGAPANVIVLDAESRYEAIRTRALPRYVIANGRLLLEHHPARLQWHQHGSEVEAISRAIELALDLPIAATPPDAESPSGSQTQDADDFNRALPSGDRTPLPPLTVERPVARQEPTVARTEILVPEVLDMDDQTLEWMTAPDPPAPDDDTPESFEPADGDAPAAEPAPPAPQQPRPSTQPGRYGAGRFWNP